MDVAGEWFKADPESVISQALQTGAGPNVSDAYTFNGLPGPTYNCSSSKGFFFFYFSSKIINMAGLQAHELNKAIHLLFF